MSDRPFDTEVFRIDWRRGPLLVMLAVLGALVVGTFATGIWGLLVAALPLAFGAVIAWSFGTVALGPAGLTLYRVNRANWSELTRVEAVSVLGLPYLRVWRSDGLPWFVPLYVTGPRPLSQSLAAWVPHTSALAASLEVLLQVHPPGRKNAA